MQQQCPGPAPNSDTAPRIYAYLDMDAFFASVSLRHRPELADKPGTCRTHPLTRVNSPPICISGHHARRSARSVRECELHGA